MQFIDLAAQQLRIKSKIDAHIQAVLAHGKYIMGPEVYELEEKLARFCGAKYCISCANGTDAIVLALMALGIGKGAAVIVPSFTFAATAEAPCLAGAVPVFADIDPDTYNIDPQSVVRCLGAARSAGLSPKAIIAVDLFGLPANYPDLIEIARAEGLKLICDSAQGWGGMINGRMTGTFGDITTTSFFPAKPLGCYGDGGALFTDDHDIAQLLDSLRVHGKGREKYDNVRIGTNSRLDTLQAAILLEKLAIYADELKARQQVAERYTSALGNLFKTPYIPDGYISIWAQYTLQAENAAMRDAIIAKLNAHNIPSGIYYPRPLHCQAAFQNFPSDPKGQPISNFVAKHVFSLPIHPYLEAADQNHIITTLGK